MTRFTASLAALVLATSLVGAVGHAQSSYQSGYSSGLNIGRYGKDRDNTGNQSNQNNQNNRNNTKATPTPTPTNRANAGKAAPTRSSTRGTSGTQTARPGTSKPSSGGPSKSGGAPGATTTGQIKEVTKGLLDSVRTKRVNFDSEAMAKKPGVVILNARKLQPEQSRLERESAGTAKTESIARPL